ncbi:long-chain fatty acid--CoA ligase [Arthrobacter sp. RIT-PI-e]|uniref:AMP-dependent synthetase/ligase n=1 Tax=Arthrobacter sp. RIT-PI-e TaxID=1681197 RepID=UPI0006766EB6|nr:AMP-dependent synthetase/ligase [Arthrobacter sp. RIT-PI-e]KNC19854.1 long-chain fatty acid--CoA ligase [Arthrobacter sp. RIT-PI-e]
MREAITELLVDLPETSNVTDLLLSTHDADPQRTLYAVRDGSRWRDVSAAEFLQQVRALAKGLIDAGIRPGDTVAVMSRTRYEWTLADVAIWFAGAVTVPVYETSSAHQVAWILEDATPAVVFVEDPHKAATVLDAAERAGRAASTTVVQLTEEGAGGLATLSSLSRSGDGVPDTVLEAARSSRQLADPASIVYTSGTTGRPKGCVITHGNFALFGVNTLEFLPEFLKQENARTLMFLPLAHVLARAVQVVCFTGGITLAHSGSAAQLLEDLGTFRPTFLLAVPRIFEKIHATAGQRAADSGKGRLFAAAERTAVAWSRAVDARGRGGSGPSVPLRAAHAVFDRILYPRLRAVFGGEVTYTVSGASPLNEHLTHFFRGAGILVEEGYGLTESTAPCTVNTVNLTRVGTVGLPMPGTSIRIADDGEVQVRGAGIFAGYHRNETATAEAFTDDGYFRTGDLGSLDEDGFLSITGRKKDLIVTAGGKNVAPGPLEEKLREHGLVAQAVLVGEGKPFVAALITLDRETLDAWASEHGKSGLGSAEAATDPDVLAAVQTAVDAANATVSRAEQIRKFTLLDIEFTVESGHLTPTLKVKRAAVVADHVDAVAALYGTAER